MLKDKIILITGASRGIGRATAVILAKAGAQVVLHGRTEESLIETKAAVSEVGLSPFTVLYDMKDETAIKQAVLDIKNNLVD